MRSGSAFFAAVLVASCVSANSQVVSNQSILNVQPNFDEIGVSFTAPMTIMLLNGFTIGADHTYGSFDGTYTEFKNLINDVAFRDDAVLYWGGHGLSSGSVAVLDAASTQNANLIVAQATAELWNVELGDFGVLSGTGTIVATKHWCDVRTTGRDVSLILACYGELASDFNATTHVGGVGLCAIELLGNNLACVVTLMLQEAFKSFDIAVPICEALAGDPANWVLTLVKGGTTQLFDFCEEEQQLPEAISQLTSGCPYKTEARIADVRTVGGVVSWTALSEDNTAAYAVELVRESPREIQLIAYRAAGEREYLVLADEMESYDFARIVEFETTGKRKVLAVEPIGMLEAAPVAMISEPASRLEISSQVLEGLSPSPEHNRGAVVTSGSPTLVIFTISELLAPVYVELGPALESLGETVEIVNTSPLDVSARSSWIRQEIDWYEQFDGITNFMIVADDTASAGGADGVPIPDPSDQYYADVNDGDGIPDVVVTRVPALSASEVTAYRDKMKTHGAKIASSEYTFLQLIDDIDSPPGGVGSGAERVAASEAVAEMLNGLNGGITVQTLLRSLGDAVERADSTTAVLNRTRPELLGAMGMTSILGESVAGFLTKNPFGDPIFSVESLDTNTVVAMTMAILCRTGNPSRYDDESSAPCRDFLLTPGRGGLAWVGCFGDTYQSVNIMLSLMLADELGKNPGQAMAESFRRAVARVHPLVSHDPELLGSLQRFHFLGDPISRFRTAATLEAFVRRAMGGTWEAMDTSYARGCPEGDLDNIVVSVTFDTDPTASYPAANFGVVPISNTDRVVFAPNGADSDAVYVGDHWETTITISEFGGCGTDSIAITYDGDVIGYAPIVLRSPDLVMTSGSAGIVGLQDWSKYTQHHESTPCDCIYTNPYLECANYSLPPDTLVGFEDFNIFAQHYQHEYSATPPSVSADVASAGTVNISFEEERPVVGQRTLRVHVALEDVEAFRVAMLAFRNESRQLQFIGWETDPAYEHPVLLADIERSSVRQLMIGIVGGKDVGGDIALGTARFRVIADGDLAISEDDLALLAAELLDIDGRPMAFGSAERQETPAPAFENLLVQNYPNPFNPTTTIAYSVAGVGPVELMIYNVKGQLVRKLVDKRQSPNIYRVVWDGSDNQGNGVASGVYFYRLKAGTFTQTKKMVLIR